LYFGNQENISASVSLTSGDNRADFAFRALQPFSNQIKQAIGTRRVVLKPNNLRVNLPICATHVDTLEGVLEFLKSILTCPPFLKNKILALKISQLLWLSLKFVALRQILDTKQHLDLAHWSAYNRYRKGKLPLQRVREFYSGFFAVGDKLL